ncbi:MAG TPA: nuclear transport factor 2 family protein, partial [Gemmatimonadaceae bacterium]|nr:nuclear transport factor 2 family protein [Gemmatimonadaceae bacterium]
MRLNRTATLAIALMIAPVALLRSDANWVHTSSLATEEALPGEAQRVMDGWLAALNDGELARLDEIVTDTVRLNGEVHSRAVLRAMIARWRNSAEERQARAKPLMTDGELVGIWTWAESSPAGARAAGMPSKQRAYWLGA